MKAKARRKNNKKIIKKKNIDWAYFDIVLPLVQKDDLDNTNPKKKYYQIINKIIKQN